MKCFLNEKIKYFTQNIMAPQHFFTLFALYTTGSAAKNMRAMKQQMCNNDDNKWQDKHHVITKDRRRLVQR